MTGQGDLFPDLPTPAVVPVALVPGVDWTVWVPGAPVPQGSKMPMAIYRGSKAAGTREFTGKITMLERSGQKRKATLAPWREAVAAAAIAAWDGPPLDVPVLLGCEFLLPPWKSTRAGDWPVGSRTGDLDKLIRAVGDALTHTDKSPGVWADDRFVVGYLGYPLTSKRFATSAALAGVRITLRLPDPA